MRWQNLAMRGAVILLATAGLVKLWPYRLIGWKNLPVPSLNMWAGMLAAVLVAVIWVRFEKRLRVVAPLVAGIFCSLVASSHVQAIPYAPLIGLCIGTIAAACSWPTTRADAEPA